MMEKRLVSSSHGFLDNFECLERFLVGFASDFGFTIVV
jgi:hypothetical protein